MPINKITHLDLEWLRDFRKNNIHDKESPIVKLAEIVEKLARDSY